VYDLRQEQIKQHKTSWRELAKQVFPNDSEIDVAIRKTRRHYDIAKKMIDGGWEQLL
jgi:hypothetical protein